MIPATVSPAWTVVLAGALIGGLLGPVAAAGTATIPGGRWPWQRGDRRWLVGAPATYLRRVLMVPASAVVLGSLAAAIGWRPAVLGFFCIGLVGVMLFVIDLDHHRLPNRLTGIALLVSVPALALDAVVTGSWPALVRAGLCAAVAFALLLAMALISPQGMGLGDVKLAGVLGLHTGWLSWELAVLALLASFLLGGLAALCLIATGRIGLRAAIAFGPALLAGAWLVVVASAWLAWLNPS